MLLQHASTPARWQPWRSGRASHVHAHETIVLCIGKQGNVLHLQGRGHEGQQSLWSTRRNSSTQLVQSGQLLAMHIIPFLQKKRAVPAALFAPPLVNAILLVLWCWHSVQPSSTSPCSATWPHPALGCRCWSPAGEQPAGEKYRRWLPTGLAYGALAAGFVKESSAKASFGTPLAVCSSGRVAAPVSVLRSCEGRWPQSAPALTLAGTPRLRGVHRRLAAWVHIGRLDVQRISHSSASVLLYSRQRRLA